jgi:imidazolonepropionase-like amidohydrolase
VRAALSAVREGFTTVRECGSEGGATLHLKRAIDGGAIPGPRSRMAGAPIGVPGGHAWQVTPQVSGEAEWAREVRCQIRDGADWIKIFASEGGVRPAGGLPVLVLTRRRERGRVACRGQRRPRHVDAGRGPRQPPRRHRALARRWRGTIEHGIFLQPEQAARMAETTTALVPTLSVYRQSAVESWGRGPGSREMNERLWERHRQAVALAIGTDSIGDVVEEVQLLAGCGMSVEQALAALTLGNAGLLGLDGEIGDIAEGYVADLVVVDGDPTNDPAALRSITHVMQDGDLREISEIGMRTGRETAEWNTASLVRGR